MLINLIIGNKNTIKFGNTGLFIMSNNGPYKN
jgi:hypothetical protein